VREANRRRKNKNSEKCSRPEKSQQGWAARKNSFSDYKGVEETSIFEREDKKKNRAPLLLLMGLA